MLQKAYGLLARWEYLKLAKVKRFYSPQQYQGSPQQRWKPKHGLWSRFKDFLGIIGSSSSSYIGCSIGNPWVPRKWHKNPHHDTPNNKEDKWRTPGCMLLSHEPLTAFFRSRWNTQQHHGSTSHDLEHISIHLSSFIYAHIISLGLHSRISTYFTPKGH